MKFGRSSRKKKNDISPGPVISSDSDTIKDDPATEPTPNSTSEHRLHIYEKEASPKSVRLVPEIDPVERGSPTSSDSNKNRENMIRRLEERKKKLRTNKDISEKQQRLKELQDLYNVQYEDKINSLKNERSTENNSETRKNTGSNEHGDTEECHSDADGTCSTVSSISFSCPTAETKRTPAIVTPPKKKSTSPGPGDNYDSEFVKAFKELHENTMTIMNDAGSENLSQSTRANKEQENLSSVKNLDKHKTNVLFTDNDSNAIDSERQIGTDALKRLELIGNKLATKKTSLTSIKCNDNSSISSSLNERIAYLEGLITKDTDDEKKRHFNNTSRSEALHSLSNERRNNSRVSASKKYDPPCSNDLPEVICTKQTCSDCSQSMNDMAKLKKELERKNERISQLEAELEQKEIEHQITLKELFETKEELARKTKEFEEAIFQCKSDLDNALNQCADDAKLVERALVSLNTQRDTAVLERNQALRQIQTLNNAISSLKDQIAEDNSGARANRESCEAMTKELAKSRREWEATLQSHNRDITQLEGALHACALEREKATCDFQAAMEQVSRLKEMVAYYEEERKRQEERSTFTYYWKRFLGSFGFR